MTWLDRFLRSYAPGLALKRITSRQRVDMLRKFEAASASRLRKDNRSKGSPDAIGQGAIQILRNRGRYLDENYDVASGILDVLVNRVVGAGVQSHSTVQRRDGTLHTELNKFLAALWGRFIVSPDVTRASHWYEDQRLLGRAWFRDGEGFANLLSGPIEGLVHAGPVQFSIDLIEADLVPLSSARIGDREVRQGIERDQWGRPLRYWVHRRHPGDFLGVNLTTINSTGFAMLTPSDFNIVEAENMIHLKFTKRIKQTRGISVFATVFDRLEDLKEYEEAERIAAKIGAFVVMQITKSPDIAAATGNVGEDKSPRELDWYPGMIFDQLVAGEEVQNLKPERPNNQLKDFAQEMMRRASSGTMTGYSSIARDYSGTYSAQRQELLETEVHYDVLTEEFISRVVRPTHRRFIRTIIADGVVPAELLADVDILTIENAAYRGPGVAYIDPLKEVRAEGEAIQFGLQSKTRAILARGDDPMEIETEIAAERERDKAAGVVSTSDPANKSGAPPPIQSVGTEDGDTTTDDDGRGYTFSKGVGWIPDAIIDEKAA